MPNPIKYVSPHNIKGIKNLNEYLCVLKKITNFIENKKSKIDAEGILIIIRWSFKKKCWVGDRCTNLERDKSGISIENLSNIDLENKYKLCLRFLLNYIEKKQENILNYNLHKNENKVLAFKITIKDNLEITSSNIVFVGLFKINRSKSCDIIDASKETIDKISKSLDLINSETFIDVSRLYLFEDFIKSLKNKSFSVIVNNKIKNIFIENIISENKKIFQNKICINNKKYDKFNNNLFNDLFLHNKNLDEITFNNIVSNLTVVFIESLYFDFIKSTNKDINDNDKILIYDKINKKMYKLINICYNKEQDSLDNKNTKHSHQTEFNSELEKEFVFNLFLPKVL